MSGLEVISAISSIITLVEFSQKVLARAAELRANGKDVGEAFLRINDLLPPINHAVKRTKERIERKEIDDETCTSLIPTLRGVQRTLDELSTVLRRFTPEEGASKLEVFWKAGRTVFQEKKVNGILQRLHEYVGVLTLSHAEAADAGRDRIRLERFVEKVEPCAEHLQRDDVPSNAQETQKHYEVPRKLVRNFIGREETLSKIDCYFSTADVPCPKVLVLYALGGQGKSQIALKYCEKLRQSHQCIFWINASSEITTRDAFERFATVLDGTSASKLRNKEEKIKYVLRTLESWETRCILVFDNYDSPEVFDLRNYFPRSGPGEILITSRNQNLGRFGELLEVPAMTSDEGLKLLLPDPSKREKNKDEGARIVERLGGLALAIDQAAAYINDRRLGIEEFLPTYADERKKILKYTPDYGWEYSTMQHDGQVEKDMALSAFTTWNMSFQRLFLSDPQKQKKALHFLTLHTFLDYLNVAEDLFQTFWQNGESPPEWLTIFVEPTEEDGDSDSSSSEHDFPSDDDSLASAHSSEGQPSRLSLGKDTVQSGSKLHSQDIRTNNEWKSDLFQDLRAKCHHLSLLHIQSDDDQPSRKHQIFSLHPLIRDWLQVQVKKDEQRSYLQEAIDIVSVSIRSFKSRNTTTDQKRALLANMDACISNDKWFSKTRKTLTYIDNGIAGVFGNMYSTQERWKEAEELFVHLTRTSLMSLGQEHPNTLISMGNLASTYWGQNRWKEAEELGVQVMEMSLRVLGLEHPYTLAIMHNLALTYHLQNRWKEAEELEVQVIETSLRVLGQEHPDTLISMGNLASTYQQQNRWKEAEELQVQVMETSLRVLGLEHPHTLAIMHNLTSTYSGQNRWKEAEELEVKVLETRVRIFGQDHLDTLASMNNLATTFLNQGQFEKAKELWVPMLRAAKLVLGEEHPYTLTSMGNLAWTLKFLNRDKEALDLISSCLKIQTRVLGADHPDTLECAQINDLMSVQI